MTYEDFLEAIQIEVGSRVEDACTVRVAQVRKNNGVMMEGLTILRPGEPVSPNIYLNPLYERYRKGTDIEQIADQILEQYRAFLDNSAKDTGMLRDLMSSETVLKNVVYRLINTDRNKDLLEEIPHKEFLDLSLAYYVLVRESGIGSGAVLVKKEHLERLGISEEQLDLAARANTPDLLPPQIVNLSKILDTFMFELGLKDTIEDPKERGSSPMFVLSNSERQFGACYMTNRKVLREFAGELEEDLYILPSSVHECMLIPASFGETPENLTAMVRDINRTQIEPQDFLSDNVYLYCRSTDRVEIAA